jgi:hypothetical protein
MNGALSGAFFEDGITGQQPVAGAEELACHAAHTAAADLRPPKSRALGIVALPWRWETPKDLCCAIAALPWRWETPKDLCCAIAALPCALAAQHSTRHLVNGQ